MKVEIDYSYLNKIGFPRRMAKYVQQFGQYFRPIKLFDDEKLEYNSTYMLRINFFQIGNNVI